MVGLVQVQSPQLSEAMEGGEGAAARQERVARYKEERRRQLAAQYGARDPGTLSSSSSGGGGVSIRSTRASRLRSATTAANHDSGKGGDVTGRKVTATSATTNGHVNGRLGPAAPDLSKEKSPVSDTSSSSAGLRRDRDRDRDRDKSAKRKSHLNRSLNAEPTPEDVLRRRRSVASSSPAQSPAKSPRHTPVSVPESDTPRSTTTRSNKRITPPRESPKPRPKSSSGLLERQSSTPSATPPSPAAELSPAPPVVNGTCHSPSAPELPKDAADQSAQSLPDVVVLTSLPARPSSILKKKSIDESPSVSNGTSCKPVSILKRKTSQEEGPGPVTFSPSVVEASSRRQGILKKHRSLDEGSVSAVSCGNASPILRHQRRSSLEEVTRRSRSRTHSPEPQSILKRKTSRDEAVEVLGSSEPQGILKRKTSTGSTGPVHVTIADTVIMAVAGEDALADDTVKPILKKKSSICEEPPHIEEETPRPILKKKSSSETEDNDEKPKRPILKPRRDSTRVSESRASFTDLETVEVCANEAPVVQQNEVECNAEPPSALSAPAESCSPERSGVVRRTPRIYDPEFMLKRRSFDSWARFKEDQAEVPRLRTSFSVAERVMNMEHFLALETQDVQRARSMSPTEAVGGKGAVPKRIRDRERYRTQPITVQELNNSRIWHCEEAEAGMQAAVEEPPPPHPHPLARSDSVSARASMFEAQLRQNEEETKTTRPLRGSAARRVKLDPSRFQTQPVTQDEVKEAKRVNESAKPSSDEGAADDDPNDPSKLSLAERVKLFNQKMVSDRLSRSGRHKTQPVTTEEVETAQKLRPISRTASSVLVSGILKNLTEKNDGPKGKNKQKDLSDSEEEEEPAYSPQKRGILKSHSQSWKNPKTANFEERESPSLKGVLKKEKKTVEPDRRSTDLHSILKVSRDRGSSSSEETETESEDDKPNDNSDLIELLHKVEAQARGERRLSPERRKSSQVNNRIEEPEKLMNLKNLDQGKENYDGTRRVRRKKVDGADMSEGDSSSSGGREVRKIIANEAVARRRQAGLAKEAAERGGKGDESPLSKSRSHSAMNGEVEVALRPPSGATPLRRCRTQPMDEPDEALTNGVSIAKRLEALQKRGNTDWKKRISRPPPEIELTATISINDTRQVLKEQLTAPVRSTVDDKPPALDPLDRRLGQLETSSQAWKKRVSPSDATQFSVAGRMPAVPVSPLPSPALERKKRVPKPERFRSSKGSDKDRKDVQSMPTSPDQEATPGLFKRSISAPGGDEDMSPVEGEAASGPLVSVPSAYDDGFNDFFASTSATDERIELLDEDLENITTNTSQLLGQRRTVKFQRRHTASTNPLKALAARTDLRTEYMEVKTGVAQREEKRLRIEKLANNSNLAVEALAGLASKENFAAIQLRRASESTAHLSPMLPYKDLMLMQVKGRRHVQTRLVRPHYTSVNQGDSYVLVTPTHVFHWVGEFSNVIEKSRGAEIAQNIVHTKDLGCGATQVTTLQGSQPHKQFWKLLGADDETAATYTGAGAGHPDEDELYECALTDTNMVYELQGEELVPRDDCWGTIPKIEILAHNKVLVLDFGSELYVWMGKTVTVDRRRTALRLAQELWGQGYNYSECHICPVTQAQYLGTRHDDVKKCPKSDSSRPEWALLAKVTQHMETVLLREKFLDWPDFSRVIQVKTTDKTKQQAEGLEIKPCDAEPMVNWSPPEPDLQLEGSHLGRGTKFYDPETHRHFEISTTCVTVWHVQEFESTELESASVGQLHTGDSYVIRWSYTVTVSGRELNGQPSRHSTVGRDRCAYWTWQGAAASTNDKGAAALLTVQLDRERGPQLRLAQGAEPPAFRQLFDGGLVVHSGRRCDADKQNKRWRLYMVLGEETREAMLVEVVSSVRQLRSRACFILLDTDSGALYLWRGAQAQPHTHQVALAAVEKLKEHLPTEAGLQDVEKLTVKEISEGKEPKVFFEALGGSSRQLYMSLSAEDTHSHTPRLFRLSSVSGIFQATPVTPACHSSQLATPFPYMQHDLYSARQPALFLLDTGDRLWLWQGWWERREGGEDSEEESGGSSEVRWQAERSAAMTTALEYGRLRSPPPAATPPAHLVWAGLEPLAFTNLFPTWEDRDDVAELNIRDGRKPGEVLAVEGELARLTRSTHPPAQLLQRPLPDGVDPTRLEDYLAPHHFQDILGLSKEEFAELPVWKQNKLKQEKGLF